MYFDKSYIKRNGVISPLKNKDEKMVAGVIGPYSKFEQRVLKNALAITQTILFNVVLEPIAVELLQMSKYTEHHIKAIEANAVLVTAMRYDETIADTIHEIAKLSPKHIFYRKVYSKYDDNTFDNVLIVASKDNNDIYLQKLVDDKGFVPYNFIEQFQVRWDDLTKSILSRVKPYINLKETSDEILYAMASTGTKIEKKPTKRLLLRITTPTYYLRDKNKVLYGFALEYPKVRPMRLSRVGTKSSNGIASKLKEKFDGFFDMKIKER